MKYIFFSLIAFALFWSGCSARHGLFAPDVVAEKALTMTRKGEIYNSLEIKASMVATYLNPLLKRYNDPDKACFLVSIFIDNDYSEPEKQGLFNPDYEIRMNGWRPLDIRPLDKNDNLIKFAPVQNMWSRYYLVVFPRRGAKRLKITLKSHRYGACAVTFPAD